MGLDFLILGVHRCGTTTLYKHMAEHPQVCRPLYKELNFFNIEGRYANGQRYYEAHVRMSHEGKHFEATVGHFEHLLVPFRVKKWYPNCKFIILFRDPVNRAYSHYWQAPFKETANKSVIEFEEMTWAGLKGLYPISWLQRGVYWYKLAHWWEVFPKNRFLCIKSEDMFQDREKVFKKVQEFLGLEVHKTKRHVQAASRARGKVPPEIRPAMEKYFKPSNDKLEKMTGINWDYNL